MLRISKIANTKLELFAKVGNFAKDPTIGNGPSFARGREKSRGPGPRGHEYEMTGRISDVSIAVKRRACVPRRGFRDVVGDIGHRRRPLSQGSPKGEAGRANPGWHARGGRQRPVGPPNEINNRISSIPISGRGIIDRGHLSLSALADRSTHDVTPTRSLAPKTNVISAGWLTTPINDIYGVIVN